MNRIETLYYDNKPVYKRAIDILFPDEKKTGIKTCALFYIHGGGWTGGSRDLYHQHMMHFARRGYCTATAGYRLVPSVRIREQMTDLIRAYEVFQAALKKKFPAVKKTIVLGSSAGAHLSSLLALTKPGTFGKIRLSGKWIPPVACVSVCGPGTVEKHKNMNPVIYGALEKLLGASYADNPGLFIKASPITHVHAGSPDFYFILARDEDCFPHVYINEMAEKLRRCGSMVQIKTFPAEHGFFYFLDSPVQKQALRSLEKYLSQYGCSSSYPSSLVSPSSSHVQRHQR